MGALGRQVLNLEVEGNDRENQDASDWRCFGTSEESRVRYLETENSNGPERLEELGQGS